MNFRRYRELKRKGMVRAVMNASVTGLQVKGFDPDDGSELAPVFQPMSLPELQSLERANRDAADELMELIRDIEALSAQ